MSISGMGSVDLFWIDVCVGVRSVDDCPSIGIIVCRSIELNLSTLKMCVIFTFLHECK